MKNTCRKYIWNSKVCKENYKLSVDKRTNCIQNSLGYDITKKGAGPLYCNFLFAPNNGNNIQDIIEDENYIRDIK